MKATYNSCILRVFVNRICQSPVFRLENKGFEKKVGLKFRAQKLSHFQSTLQGYRYFLQSRFLNPITIPSLVLTDELVCHSVSHISATDSFIKIIPIVEFPYYLDLLALLRFYDKLLGLHA